MPLLADLLVPFAADGHVDAGAARAHALWLLTQGVDGFAVGVGEFLHVDRKEKEKLLDVVADVAQRRTVLFPIWDPSPAYVLKLGKGAAERGATALLPPPILSAVPDDAVVDWYRSVCAHLGGASVLAWHDPSFGCALTPRLLARLLAETGIAGWFDASGEACRVRRLADEAPKKAWISLDAAPSATELGDLAGIPDVAGGVSRLASAWPDLLRRAWDERTEPLLDAVVRRRAAVDRAGGVPALKRLLGLGARLPIAGVDEAEAERLPGTKYR